MLADDALPQLVTALSVTFSSLLAEDRVCRLTKT